jgi:uncharacterized RDD family membrane protein YckC
MTVPSTLSTWDQGLRPDPATVGRPAGFWIRLVAYIIDALILGVVVVVMIGVFAAIAALSGKTSDEELPPEVVVLGVLMLLAYVAAAFLYEVLLTASPRGGTLGKRALGLRVVRADGTQLSFGRSTARYLLKVLITPLVPFAIGYILAGFTKGKRALHDLMAETLVIRQP